MVEFAASFAGKSGGAPLVGPFPTLLRVSRSGGCGGSHVLLPLVPIAIGLCILTQGAMASSG